MNAVIKADIAAPSEGAGKSASGFWQWFRRHNLFSKEMRLETRLEAAIVNLETRIWDATRGKQPSQIRPEEMERIKSALRPFIKEARKEKRKGNYEDEALLFSDVTSKLFFIGIDCEKKGNPAGVQVAYSIAASFHGFSAGAYGLAAEVLERKSYQLPGGEKEAAIQEIERLRGLEVTEHGSQAACFFLARDFQKAEAALKQGSEVKAKNSELITLHEFAELIFSREADLEKRSLKTDVSGFPLLGKGLKMLENLTNAVVVEKPGNWPRILIIGEIEVVLPTPKYRTEKEEEN